MKAASGDFPRVPLAMLATGTFAIGTEGFMIAPLLPSIAQSLQHTLVEVGQLVTGFTLTYGLSSPLLTAASARMDRRRLLLLSLSLFLVGNLVCVWAGDLATLMLARLLMGAAAGLYMPNANAVGSGLVSAERRGRALSMVAGGQSLAIAIGVPLAALLGAHAGWRATFLAVAALTAVAFVGVSLGLKSQPVLTAPVGWRERFSPLKQPPLLAALSVTVLWAAGAYTMLTYLAAYLADTLGVKGALLGAFMAVWGVSAATGVFLGGAANDRFGAPVVLRVTLIALAASFLCLWAVGQMGGFPYAVRLSLVVLSLVVWGSAVWGFFPAQQARLIELGGTDSASLVLSLNSSSMYIGFASGAALGGAVIQHFRPGALGIASFACEALALSLVLLAAKWAVGHRPRSAAPSPHCLACQQR